MYTFQGRRRSRGGTSGRVYGRRHVRREDRSDRVARGTWGKVCGTQGRHVARDGVCGSGYEGRHEAQVAGGDRGDAGCQGAAKV